MLKVAQNYCASSEKISGGPRDDFVLAMVGCGGWFEAYILGNSNLWIYR